MNYLENTNLIFFLEIVRNEVSFVLTIELNAAI